MSEDLFKYAFSFAAIQWVTVELSGKEYRLKYKPLSIIEKMSIHNKYEGEDKVDDKIAEEYCVTMLTKAGYDISQIKVFLSKLNINTIYGALLSDIQDKKKKIGEFYDENKTVAIKPSKGVSNSLDSLVNVCLICKEMGLSMEDVGNLDEVSLSCLMMGMNEMATRESNSLEQARNK